MNQTQQPEELDEGIVLSQLGATLVLRVGSSTPEVLWL